MGKGGKCLNGCVERKKGRGGIIGARLEGGGVEF